MKKKFIALLSVVLIALLFTACTEENNSNSSSQGETTTTANNSKYPTANNTVEGKNVTEKCYNMDSDTFTQKFNELYKEKTGKEGPVLNYDKEYVALDKDNWQVVGEQHQEDGSTKSTSYYQSTEKAEIILAIDDDTKKIINYSVATTNAVWKKSAKKVKTIAIIGAIALGGYSTDNYKFFNDLFDTAISGMCYYDNVAYKVAGSNYIKDKEDDMVIKLMSIPTSKNALRVTSYTDYVMYKEGKCDFGQHTEKTTTASTTKKNK